MFYDKKRQRETPDFACYVLSKALYRANTNPWKLSNPEPIVATVSSICPLVELSTAARITSIVERLAMGVMSSTVKGTHQRASSRAGYSHMDTATGVGSRTREVTELLQSLHWKPFCLASVFPCKSVTTIAAVHELMQKYYRANADFRVKKDPQTTVHQGKRNQQTTNPRVSMTLIQADYCFSIHCV